MSTETALPPPPDVSALTTPLDLIAKHSNGPTAQLITLNRVRWALRNRTRNGLLEARVVFESPYGRGLLIDEKAFVAWLVGLAGLHKPRSRAKPRGKPLKSRTARAWRARQAAKPSSASAP